MYFLSGDEQDTVPEPEGCVVGMGEELQDPKDKENRRQDRVDDVGLTPNRAVRGQGWEGRSWLHLLGPAPQRRQHMLRPWKHT